MTETGVRLFFAACLLFALLTAIYNIWLCLAELVLILLLYLFFQTGISRRKKEVMAYLDHMTSGVDVASRRPLISSPLPIAIFRPDTDGIIWSNERFLHLTGDPDHLFETKLSALVPSFQSQWLLDGDHLSPEPVPVGDQLYLVFGNLVCTGGQDEFLATTYWVDVTEYARVAEQFDATRPVVVGCIAFLGGISKNYGTNLLLSATSPYTVIEADEFDRSFHWLSPWMSVITATDPDHLDIYGTKEAYLESFRHYTTLIQPGGALILHKGLEMQADVQPGVTTYTYSRNEGDFHAENIRIGNGEIFIDFVAPDTRINDIQLGVPVSINIENGVAAMALAHLSGATDEEIKQGMASFRGVDRRFDFKLKNDRIVFLSDYAHHPAEIAQSVKSVRELYQDKKITVIFQPHLYTRTRDFYRDFADSLSLSDEVILTEIYPAREQPIPGVTSQLIYDNLRPGIEKCICRKEDVLSLLAQKHTEVLVVLGAGDLDNYAPQITQLLSEKYHG